MQRVEIRKYNGQIIGYYDVEDNGDKTVRDYSGRILGYYIKSTNTTTLYNRTIIARGDVSGIFFKDDISF